MLIHDAIFTQAAQALRNGRTVAYPTEAVWGVGCDPDNTTALERLLALKQRDPAKGVILIAGDIDQFAPWLEGLAPELYALLLASWPGPVTWLVPDNGRTHPLVRGQHDCVALRVSAHPGVQQLTHAFGGPIVSTSANLAGCPPLMSADAVTKELGHDLFIVPGALGGRDRPSDIRDLQSGDYLRQ